MRAIPPLPVPTQPPSGPPPTTTGGGVEPWIIIVSVIAAVLFIAVLAGLLWGVRHLTYNHILLSLPYNNNHTTHPQITSHSVDSSAERNIGRSEENVKLLQIPQQALRTSSMQKLSLLAIQLMARNRLLYFVTILNTVTALHFSSLMSVHVVYSYFLTRFLVIPVFCVHDTFKHCHYARDTTTVLVKFEKLVGVHVHADKKAQMVSRQDLMNNA